jgi:uncharacterized protein (TIGR02266 family)
MIAKILLVDDVNMFLDLQKTFLKLSSVHLLTARNGLEALDVARKERPSLIFMDLHMPLMNGADCCARIKADPDFKSLPVVMITSEGKEEDRDICVNAGCDDFLTKPLDRSLYMATARKYLPDLNRRDLRVPCQALVKFRAFGMTLSGELLNISKNGIYVATNYEMAYGTPLDISFTLPDGSGSAIQARGKVAWMNNSSDRKKREIREGFGVEFTAVTDESRDALERFIGIGT